MRKDLNIHVHHLTRVEGHGDIVVDIKKGFESTMNIVKAPTTSA
jgi:coenzyme F420-reducing hydrogenase alpha subunit